MPWAEKSWIRSPSCIGEPSLDRMRQGVVDVGASGQFSGEDGSVSADGAGNVDSGFFGLATAAMVPGDGLAWYGGVPI